MTNPQLAVTIAAMATVGKGINVGLDDPKGRKALLEARDPVRALAIRLQEKQWQVQEYDSDNNYVDRTEEAINAINALMYVVDQLVVAGQVMVPDDKGS